MKEIYFFQKTKKRHSEQMALLSWRIGGRLTLCQPPIARELTLGVLRTLACFSQTDLLTLNCTRIAGDKTGFTQRRTQLLIIGHQSTGQTMTNRACLTKAAATTDSHFHIKRIAQLQQLQRLPHNHAR